MTESREDAIQKVLKAMRAIPPDAVPDIEKAVISMDLMQIAAYYRARGINQAEAAFLEAVGRPISTTTENGSVAPQATQEPLSSPPPADRNAVLEGSLAAKREIEDLLCDLVTWCNTGPWDDVIENAQELMNKAAAILVDAKDTIEHLEAAVETLRRVTASPIAHPVSWVATKDDGANLRFSVADGWKVEPTDNPLFGFGDNSPFGQ